MDRVHPVPHVENKSRRMIIFVQIVLNRYGPNILMSTPNPTKIERASNACYLLPVFFSILGGNIGYVGVKDRDSGKAAGILVVGIIIFVIELSFFCLSSSILGS